MTIERAREVKSECRKSIVDLEFIGETETAMHLLAVMDSLDRYIRAVEHVDEVYR